jgi:hypothetical protein
MFIEDEIEQPDHTENREGRVMALNAEGEPSLL